MAEKKEKDMEMEYSKLKTKYSLPELAELDREFSVGELEPTNYPLRCVMDKMHDRLDFMTKTLGNLIQPESHISDMREAEIFTDDEKKGIYELFKRIGWYDREFTIKDFDYSDEHAALLIARFWKDWKILKADFVKVLLKMRDSWGKDSIKKEEFGYFG
jgi:hypothetical protein